MLDAKGYPKMPNSWGKTLPWEAIYFSEKIRWCLLNMILCLMTQIQWKFQSDTALKWRRWPNKNKPLYIWFITAPKDTETCKINVNPPQDWTFQSNARYNVVKIGQNWGIGQEIGHKIGKLEKIDKWWRKEKNIDL